MVWHFFKRFASIFYFYFRIILNYFIIILNKNKSYKNKILFIDALNQTERLENKNFLSTKNIKFIHNIYENFIVKEGISYIATTEEIKNKNFSLHLRDFVITDSIQELRESRTPIQKSIQIYKNSSESLANGLKQWKECVNIESRSFM